MEGHLYSQMFQKMVGSVGIELETPAVWRVTS